MANTRGKRKEMNPVDEAANVAETMQETKVLEGVVSNCSNLNVRKRMTKESEVLCTIPVDTRVSILDDSNNNWYEVQVNSNTIGFCMKEFIKVTK